VDLDIGAVRNLDEIAEVAAGPLDANLGSGSGNGNVGLHVLLSGRAAADGGVDSDLAGAGLSNNGSVACSEMEHDTAALIGSSGGLSRPPRLFDVAAGCGGDRIG
jgi:hypothetical protein